MKFLWYIISFILIILILINNPKSEGLSTLGGQGQLFNVNSKTVNILEILTAVSITLFLCFTIVLAAYYQY
uniref:preprotein translocase subunit G n=1 Tax=Rhodochorton tenue TaxID=173034 RepID=UPI002A7EABEC|nr:preprotein translocase subunit G [Rhodochorton tenue]WOK79485.1 preprotein translocase subunit G [Rhodochorton tenue]